MSEFFDILLSPMGSVGRAIWWLSAIVITGFEKLLAFGAFLLIQRHIDPSVNYFGYFLRGVHLNPEQWAQFHASYVASFWHSFGKILVLQIFILIAWWSTVAIEVKRWHDRGMSGFWLLTRWTYLFALPTIMLHLFLYLGVVLLVGFVRLVQLGFLPAAGAYGYTVRSPWAAQRAYGGYPGYPAYSRPARSSSPVSLLMGIVLSVLLLLGAVGVTVYYLQKSGSLLSLRQLGALATPVRPASPPASTPASASAATAPLAPPPSVSLPPASPPSANLDQNFLASQPSTNDNLTTLYGKDWVITGGQRVDGITKAVAAPGHQVAIYTGGGSANYPASALPAGFLDAWGITAEALEAADHPTQNP